MRACGEVTLRIDVGETGLNRGRLVAPDAPIEQLLPAGRRVEVPAAADLRHGNGKLPIVFADRKRGMRLIECVDGIPGRVCRDEFLSRIRVGDGIARIEQVGSLGAQHRFQARQIIALEGGNK